MAIDNITEISSVRPVTSGSLAEAMSPADMDEELEIEVTLDDEDMVGFEEDAIEERVTMEHGDNLVPYIMELEDGESDLSDFGQDLLEAIEIDEESRAEWQEVFKKGLKLMGIRGTENGELDSEDDDEELFEGASQLFHPLVTEACVQFQSEALKAMLPPHGPAGTKVLGAETPEKLDQASRVKNYLNYQTMHEIDGYFEEHDKLLMYLGKSGSAFKKVTFNKTRGKIDICYLPGEDVIVPYTAKNLVSSPRVTHRERHISANELAHRIASGLYMERDIMPAPVAEDNEVQTVREAQEGVTKPASIVEQDEYTILTVLVETVVPGFEGDRDGLSCPYIVHMEEETGTVLAIYRNWREGDVAYEPQDYFVHYPLVQSDGFYGYGFIHLLGQLARGSSAALRQLLDAGTLSNLQGGFKRKGTRIERDGEPFVPGEYRDVTVPGERISDSIMQLNFKEPSNVLYQLMGFLVEAGRRMVSLTDLNAGDGNQDAPVGTTIALLERGMNVMSAVHMRLCRAQKQELNIIARLCAEHLPESYPYDVPGATREVFKADFDDRVDIIPICDPRQFSQAQRIARAQAKLQLAQQFPNVFDEQEAARDMMMEIDDSNIDRLIPPKAKMEPTDPMTENMNAVIKRPLKAFMEQNHDAHMAAHMAQLQNPDYQDNGQMQAMLQAHIQEHMAMKYQVQMMQAMGITDPKQLQELPPEQLAVMAAQATQQITGQAQAMAEAEARAAEPTIEQQALLKELENDRAEIERKRLDDERGHMVDLQKIKQDDRDAELRAAGDVARMQREGQKADVQNFVSLVTALQNANQREQVRDSRTTLK